MEIRTNDAGFKVQGFRKANCRNQIWHYDISKHLLIRLVSPDFKTMYLKRVNIKALATV